MGVVLVTLSVLFLGDSITVAQTVGISTGYVERIAERRPDWEVVNAAQGGATADSWATDVRFFSPTRRWDAVVLLLGTTDAIRQTPVEDYAADMRTIASHFEGARNVFMLRPPPIGPATFVNAQSRLDTYWPWLAAESPLAADFSDFDFTTFGSLQVHPLQAGHDVMADRVEAMLLAIPEPRAHVLFCAGLLAFATRRVRAGPRSDRDRESPSPTRSSGAGPSFCRMMSRRPPDTRRRA